MNNESVKNVIAKYKADSSKRVNKDELLEKVSSILCLFAIQSKSAWDRGVHLYAIDLLCENYERLIDYLHNPTGIFKVEVINILLKGAKDWEQYSECGSALFYDEDIAYRLCNDTELKRTRYGERAPNAFESWFDVQARALKQASLRLCNILWAYKDHYKKA